MLGGSLRPDVVVDVSPVRRSARVDQLVELNPGTVPGLVSPVAGVDGRGHVAIAIFPVPTPQLRGNGVPRFEARRRDRRDCPQLRVGAKDANLTRRQIVCHDSPRFRARLRQRGRVSLPYRGCSAPRSDGEPACRNELHHRCAFVGCEGRWRGNFAPVHASHSPVRRGESAPTLLRMNERLLRSNDRPTNPPHPPRPVWRIRSVQGAAEELPKLKSIALGRIHATPHDIRKLVAALPSAAD